jgi:hypothetical protein
MAPSSTIVSVLRVVTLFVAPFARETTENAMLLGFKAFFVVKNGAARED